MFQKCHILQLARCPLWVNSGQTGPKSDFVHYCPKADKLWCGCFVVITIPPKSNADYCAGVSILLQMEHSIGGSKWIALYLAEYLAEWPRATD
jgi:hypothetical protein